MSNKPNKIIHEVLNIKNNARSQVRPLLDYVFFLTVLYIVFSLHELSPPFDINTLCSPLKDLNIR